MHKSNGNLAGNGTLYWYMTPGVVAETDLAGTTKSEYIFFGGERLARRDGVNGAGGVFYYISDHLKTASVVTDAAGTIKAESDYYPWGGELQVMANDSNHYKFTGKERDGETGLDYFGARYYSNGLGRFVTPDWAAKPAAVPYAVLGDPQSLNLYEFVGGNPASKSDPDGHDPWSWSWQVSASASYLVGELKGLADVTVKPVATMVAHPINTAVGLGHAVAHPINTAVAVKNAVVDTAKSAASGDPRAVGKVVGSIATAAMPFAKAGDVVESTNLATRAAEIHSELHPIAQNMRTTAVAEVTGADGTVSRLVSSSENALNKAQRAALQPGETAVSGAGHAEETILNSAQQNGQTVNAIGVSRSPCPTCAQKLEQAGVKIHQP